MLKNFFIDPLLSSLCTPQRFIRQGFPGFIFFDLRFI
jgi:hypothetical protein